MTAREIVHEIAYPVTHAAVLMTLCFLFVVFSFAIYGGVIGLFLLFLMLPALFRYLMVLLSWRARGLDAPTLDVDQLYWFGNAWSIFPALIVTLLLALEYLVATRFGRAWAFGLAAAAVAFLPASFAVLAITHSPLQSVDARAIAGLIRRSGTPYWVTPAFAAAAIMLVVWLSQSNLYAAVRNFVGLYLVFALFALIGGVVRANDLMQEVDIPEPVMPGESRVHAELQKKRARVLAHAYGFISRGNRSGGMKHIEQWLREDPDPRSAWEWFFQQMLRWENKDPALVFGQSYLSALLQEGETVAAVKIMMRCRIENDRFVPLNGDLATALEAARACGNQELVDFLRSRV